MWEWHQPGAPPAVADVGTAIDELLARAWLQETELSDEGVHWSVISLTDEGKAEWRRRNPLEQRLERAWFAQGDFIFAPSEEIADGAAKYLYEEIGSAEVDLTVKNVVPWTYELDGSGDVIQGVRVEFPAVRRLRRIRGDVRAGLFLIRLRFAAWRRSLRLRS